MNDTRKTTAPSRKPSPNTPEKDKKDTKDEKDAGRGFDPTRFPPPVYEELPAPLARPANCLDEGHERDTFVTGALPVCAGAMPNVRFRYGGQWLSLNHNTAAVAPSGAGKGKHQNAKQLGEKLDERIYKESQQAIEDWKARKEAEGEKAGKRPQEKALFLPGDISAAELKHMMGANPHGVIHESEFQTIGIAQNQDWGQSRDVLLKAFHNESVTVARRGEDMLRIGHPAISLALSGTPSTFREIVEDVEDGLFSRFCFYMFDAPAEWVPQFTDETDRELERETEKTAEQLNTIHKRLTRRDEPLYIRFPEAIRKLHTTACEAALEGLKAQDIPKVLYPSVKRAGVNALRFAGIFSLLRLHERAVDLSEPKSVEISKGDLRGGLYLAFSFLSHAIRVANWLEVSKGEKGLHEGHKEYLNALPSGAFDTKDANDVAERLGIDQRKARRWRRKFVSKDLLIDEGYGEWRKPSPENVPGVLSVHSVLSVLFNQNGEEIDRRPTTKNDSAPF